MRTLRSRSNKRIDVGLGRADRHLIVHFAQNESSTLDDQTSRSANDNVIEANAERSTAADGTVVRRSSDSVRILSGNGDDWIEELHVHSHEHDGKVNATNLECVQMRTVNIEQITTEAACEGVRDVLYSQIL